MGQRYAVKAGRFEYDTATKKVKVCKEKGELSISTNSQGETHLSWVDLESKLEQLDLIVFPFDAVFERLPSQNNTYLLRFQSNDDKYFFYLQEKIVPEEFVQAVNQRIAYVPEDNQMEEEPKQEQKPEKMEVEAPVEQKVETKAGTKTGGLFNSDFVQRLQASLLATRANEGQSITHLSKVLTPEAINAILNETTPEEKQRFTEFLPEEQKDVVHLAANLRSPQFQQAVDVLTDALNSQNAIPLFMELGLDQKHLRNNYGVHAFLKALEEWASKQQQQ